MINILVNEFDNVILHQKADYVLNDNNIEVWFNGSIMFIYGTLNKNLCSVYQIENEIDDFVSNKYKYINGQVVDNPNYIAPSNGG